MTRLGLGFGVLAIALAACSGGGSSGGGSGGISGSGGKGGGSSASGGSPGSGGNPGSGGAHGTGGVPGSGGQSQPGGAVGTAGTNPGSGGISSTGGEWAYGGFSGSAAGGGGAGGQAAGAGGGGAAGHPSGSGGAAGKAGAAGGAGQAGGAGGNSMLGLTLTSTAAFPAAQLAMLGLRVAVNSQDTAVVLGPSATSLTADPGPTLTWLPRSGTSTQKTFAGDITPAAMALDAADAIWLTGQLYKGVSFGGTAVPQDPTGYYLVKLTSNGSNAFTKDIARTDTNLSTTTTYAIAFDPQGNAYVAGSLMLAGSTLTSAVFVTKFTPTGQVLLDRTFPGTDTEASAYDLAVAPNGDVMVTGMFNGSLHVGSTTLTSLAGTSTNGFVAILNGDLSPRTAYSFGGADAYDVGYAVDVTSTGALRVAGALSGSSTLGGTGVSADASGSGFVAQIAPASGHANWIDLIGTQGIVFQTSTNPADRTFAVGRLDGTTHDSFLAIVEPSGALTLPKRVSTGLDANGAVSVAADRHGGAWVAGELEGRVDFGTGPIGSTTDPKALTNFLLHFEP